MAWKNIFSNHVLVPNQNPFLRTPRVPLSFAEDHRVPIRSKEEHFMKQWLIRGTLVPFLILPFFTFPTMVGAEELTAAQQEAVKQEVQRILREQGFPGGSTPPPSGSTSKSDVRRLDDLYKQSRTGDSKSGSTKEGSGALIYARPFVASPKAIVGGYMDFEYINRESSNSTFNVHRLVPFIYADISDRVKFAAEIEFENGGVGDELKIEFAVIDYLVNEPINLRGGIILLPLGKFNLLHDAPLRDLTDRPLIARRIIPTTLHQPGVGIYGTFYPTSLSQINYEVYVTSGFTGAYGGDGNPQFDDSTNSKFGQSTITQTNGLRSARSNLTNFDSNNGKAVVGRVAVSPILGVEVGLSGLYEMYDPRDQRGLFIGAVDWTFQRGPFEFIGESAWAYIEDNQTNIITGAALPTPTGTGGTLFPNEMRGYYLQLNYHFLPSILVKLAPTHFRPEVSTFTGVVRWDDINLGADLSGSEAAARGKAQRLTLGLNFRPSEDSVIKFDYQYEPEVRSSRTHSQGFLASAATYF